MAVTIAHDELSGDSQRLHAVRFYKDSHSLCAIAADFLADGLDRGQPAVVLATAAHRAGIATHLTGRGLDVADLEQRRTLVMLDAEETMARFMVNGMPDASRFTNTIVPILQRACGGRRDCLVRAYGEMVDLLWKADQTQAATRLEMLWNTIALTQPFSLLCGYAMGSFYKEGAVEDICSHHSHVLAETGHATAIA